MGTYDRQIATAARLIKAKGQSVTWRQVTDGSPADAGKPWIPGATANTDHTVDMVFLPEDRRDYEFLFAMSGMEVPTGKLTALMPAVGFTPSIKDVVIRDGVKYGIRTIDPLAPNGQVILYTVRFDL